VKIHGKRTSVSGGLADPGKNAGILRYAQNDDEEQITATATTTADPCGDDNRKSTSNGNGNPPFSMKPKRMGHPISLRRDRLVFEEIFG